MDRFQDGNGRLTERRPLAPAQPHAVPQPLVEQMHPYGQAHPSQHFLTRTDVGKVNLSQNGRRGSEKRLCVRTPLVARDRQAPRLRSRRFSTTKRMRAGEHARLLWVSQAFLRRFSRLSHANKALGGKRLS
jgi:hypothetical protein